ncbi:MAG TPA: hypothetical protein VK698_24805 [Kofleriaceae bacterium]|nr:hypothetical protein [Kofleriaceae bacterium]
MSRRRSRRGLFLLVGAALLLAAAPVGAQPASSATVAVPGPFLAASVGAGDVGDAAPGLTGGTFDLRGHLELGYGDGRFVSGALSLALARAGYANQLPPPESVQPDANLRLHRIGVGALVEGHLPMGRFTPTVGAGAYVDRLSASASGAVLGVRGEYFESTDVAPGFELRAGLDLRVHSAVVVGLRAGWSWTRADLDELTGGARWLSGPGVELRVSFDVSGFRMADPSPP